MKKGDGRNAQLVRVLILARELQGQTRRQSARLLARRHDVSIRTVWRDLAAIREAGFDIPRVEGPSR